MPGGGPVELGEVAARLGGELCENEGGRYVLVRSRYNGRQVYGGSPIADYAALDGEGLRVLGNVAPARIVREAVEALADLEEDYPTHAQAATQIAEEHFSAARVLPRLLDKASG